MNSKEIKTSPEEPPISYRSLKIAALSLDPFHGNYPPPDILFHALISRDITKIMERKRKLGRRCGCVQTVLAAL